jgi:uncharacterized membrane protein YhdT
MFMRSYALSGSYAGILVVLIGFLVIAYISSSTLGSGASPALYNLIVLAFLGLVFLLMLGSKATARFTW